MDILCGRLGNVYVILGFFLHIVIFVLGTRTGQTGGRTDRRTDEQARPVLRPVRTHTKANSVVIRYGRPLSVRYTLKRRLTITIYNVFESKLSKQFVT